MPKLRRKTQQILSAKENDKNKFGAGTPEPPLGSHAPAMPEQEGILGTHTPLYPPQLPHTRILRKCRDLTSELTSELISGYLRSILSAFFLMSTVLQLIQIHFYE